ncbi:MAG: hypothetical protein WDA21_00825 [Bacilli bacterium]
MFRETDEVREPIWRGIVIKALFLGVFVLLLLWLFPMPKVEPLLDNLFNENIQTMKEAAKNYYTNERLPEKVGSKISMTLNEMLTKKLVLPFVDGNGKQCDFNASYVEITKMETEYILKTFLSCDSRTDYIIEHLGCHDLCGDECICDCDTAVEDKSDKPKKTVSYRYQYKKVVDGYYTSWGKWSNWSTTKVTETKTKDVNKKVETETKEKLIGHNVTTTYEPVYEERLQQVGSVTGKACTASGKILVGTGTTGSVWVDEGVHQYNYSPKDTTTERYVYISSTTVACGNCVTGVVSNYRKYVLKTYTVKQEKVVCTNWDTKTIPIYIVAHVLTGYEPIETSKPVYETVKIKVNYYQYRTRKYIQGYTSIKWSSSSKDISLIKQDYKYTGYKVKK